MSDQSTQAAREATPKEWAASLMADPNPMTEDRLALVIATAIDRGMRNERRECSYLADEHALTITEVEVGQTPLGHKLDWQQQIDVAAAMRHVARYVGVLISKRDDR